MIFDHLCHCYWCAGKATRSLLFLRVKLIFSLCFVPGRRSLLTAMEKTNLDSRRQYFHICSDGNFASVIFHDPADFMAAMNRVAILAHKYHLVILAFVLMDNHIHLIVRAESKDDADRFANEFKRLTGLYCSRHYGEKGSLRRLPVKVQTIVGEDELKTKICYVLKNPTKARIGMFYDYPWGSGNLYFRDTGDASFLEMGVRVSDLGLNQSRAVFQSRQKIPKDWVVVDGLILPANYIPVKEVESLFKTPRSFMYFLSLNKDDEIEQETGEGDNIRLTDSELRQERNAISQQLFGIAKLQDLSVPQRLKLARKLRSKYLCSKKQISRIVRLPLETVIAHM